MKASPASVVLSLSVACFLIAVTGGDKVSPSPSGVPRFQAVTQFLYRGGQPTEAGFAFLRLRGIKTVVNLREEDDERSLVEKMGMRYVHLPTSAWDPIPEKAIQTFFRLMGDPASRPVFVHCERGADRTGAMIGLYRVAFQGWDGDKAYDEARALGMRWWYRDLRRQLFEFAARRSTNRNGVQGH